MSCYDEAGSVKVHFKDGNVKVFAQSEFEASGNFLLILQELFKTVLKLEDIDYWVVIKPDAKSNS